LLRDNSRRAGCLVVTNLPSEDDLTLLTAPADQVKLVTLAPEQVSGRFIGDLVNAGLRVALGHSMATYAETKQALGLGLTGFTHLFNAMRALSPRDPCPIAAALESQQAWFGMIVDGLHVDPAMLRLALRKRARSMLVTDAMPLVGSNRAEFFLFKRRIRASGEACFDDDGVLAGSVLTMSSAVRNCVKLLDVSLSEALDTRLLNRLRSLVCLTNWAGWHRAIAPTWSPFMVRLSLFWIPGLVASGGPHIWRERA